MPGITDPGYSAQRPLPGVPKIVSAAIADTGQKFHHAFERDLVARMRDEAQECGHVFDVGLLEKTDPARDLIWNATARKLQLQLDGVVMRAIKHYNVVQINISISQVENSLRDKVSRRDTIDQRSDSQLDRV